MCPFVLKSNMIALIFPFVLTVYTKCTKVDAHDSRQD
jgi:hypothetical protein